MSYYDSIAKSYDALHGAEQERKYRIIKNEIQTKNKKILDIGTGTAKFLQQLQGKRYGVDPSKELLKQCTDKDIKLHNVSAENLPFKEKEFDIVTCITALHHTKYKKAIQEIKRVAKRNATIIFSLLKKSKKYNEIVEEIKKTFNINKQINEEKDMIFFCSQ